MRILVPVKRVPDPYGRVRLKDGKIDAADLKWVINPFDEIALEQAIRMREAGQQAEIVAVTIGPAVCEEQLRAALAMGADRAILVLDDSEPDPRAVSRLLAAVYRQEGADLVLMGKQAIDDDSSQVGPRLAAILGVPQATFASAIDVTAHGTLRVTREVDAGRETVEVRLPCVITADLRLNDPRYIALPAIIKARAKPVQRIEAATLAAAPTDGFALTGLEAPPARKAGRRVGSVDELIRALREEAHAI